MPLQLIRTKEEYECLVVSMKAQGKSIRWLARHFTVSRNTIRRILRQNLKKREQGEDELRDITPPVSRSSMLDAFMPKIKEILEKFPDVKGVRMLEILREEGYPGGMTILREKLRQIRPKPKKKPVVRFETEPAEQGQMDWSPYTLKFRRSGKTKVLCFSYILGFSRRQYIDYTVHRDFYTLIRRHKDVFEYFGGVPKTCLYDNEKTVVLRWEAGHPVFNPAFIAFATHYQFKPIACKPGSPETKGKIEQPFQYVEGNFHNARVFDDFDDIRARARWWMRNRSDAHIHETTGRPPIELFVEREKQALLTLPAHPYDTGKVVLRVCSSEGWVEYETNYYSLPYSYIGDIMPIKVTEHEILIYSPFIDLVTAHERLPDGAGLSQENPAHRRSKSIRYGLEPVKESFLRLGPMAEAFINGLKDKHPRNCGFQARTILEMKQHYEAKDIYSACVHATRYHAFSADAVGRILKAKASPRTLESIRSEKAKEAISKKTPLFRQRSLDEYDML